MEAILRNTPSRNLLLMVSLAVLLAACASNVLWLQYRHYRQSLSTLQMLKNVTEHGDGLDREMQKLQQQVTSLNHRLQQDGVDLPRVRMESFLIGRLRKISRRNHIELDSVTPGTGSRVQAFEEILFHVQVTGDYFDLYQWLQDLCVEPGNVVVKQFRIDRAGSGGTSPRLRAALTLAAYRDTGHG